MNALKINKLAIIGRRKNYVIPFHSGLNIILGDSDTGKSSILELINYSLGSKKLALYKEIESTAIFVCLEFSVSGETYTLRRHILDPKLYIHIFACPFENIESTEPSYTVAPFFSLTPPADGYLSEFLFDKLAIPPIKIKQAPTKENSRTARLSFRDIFKYCYLDQDEVGSKYILDSNNPILATRNKEVFKFLFNFLDENISALQVRISEIKKEQAELKSKKLIISEFLKESGFKTLEELDKSLEVLDRELANAEDALTNISESMKSSVGNYEGVREQLLELEYVIQEMKVKLYKSDEKITQFVELKNEYLQDIDKLKTAIKMFDVTQDFETQISCPVCNQKMDASDCSQYFHISETQILAKELKTLSGRKNELLKLLDQERLQREKLEQEILLKTDTLNSLSEVYDLKTQNLVTPFIRERDALIATKTKIEEQMKHHYELSSIVKKSSYLSEQIDSLSLTLKGLREQLEKLNDNLDTEQNVLTNLGGELSNFLKFVNIKNNEGVGIGLKTYLPEVRHTDYAQLTSGGLRTITSIGYILSLLSCSIKNDIHHPNLVLVDTVGKYLGKYTSTKIKHLEDTIKREDEAEEMQDPAKYASMYQYMLNLAEKAVQQNKDCQIVVVDNDLPESLSPQLQKNITIEFDYLERNGKPKGLIDDA